jgi:hypothetical protein
VLGFTLVADTYQPEQDKRWVLVAPPGSPPGAASILLARASTPQQEAFIGNQAGGRVSLFLHTDDFWRDFHDLTAKAFRFVRLPAAQPLYTVAMFEDVYANLRDLVQRPKAPANAPRPDRHEPDRSPRPHLPQDAPNERGLPRAAPARPYQDAAAAAACPCASEASQKPAKSA